MRLCWSDGLVRWVWLEVMVRIWLLMHIRCLEGYGHGMMFAKVVEWK